MTMESESNRQLYLWHKPMSLEDDLYDQRIQRIAEIEALGFSPYGHRFDFSHTIPQVLAGFGDKPAEQLADPRIQVRVAGRVMTVRRMGKAGFAHLMQNGEQLQIYVRKDAVSEKEYALYQLLDLGDLIGVEGYLFRTKTNELSIHVEHLRSEERRVGKEGRSRWSPYH